METVRPLRGPQGPPCHGHRPDSQGMPFRNLAAPNGVVSTIECLATNQKVGGSNPSSHAKKKPVTTGFFALFLSFSGAKVSPECHPFGRVTPERRSHPRNEKAPPEQSASCSASSLPVELLASAVRVLPASAPTNQARSTTKWQTRKTRSSNSSPPLSWM